MQRLPRLSGHEVIKALVKGGFKSLRQRGSHVILVKETDGSRVGTVVPLHRELRIGTLKGIIKKAGMSDEEFMELL